MAVEHAVNIGKREQQSRFQFGIVMFVTSAILAALFLLFDVATWLRIFVAIPLWLGGVGVFQAREKT